MPEAYGARAELYFGLGQRDRAVADYQEAIRLDPNDPGLRYGLALSRLADGAIDEYRNDCRDMLDLSAEFEKPDKAHWLAWTCVLGPDGVTNWSKPLAAAETAAKSDPNSFQFQNTFGAVLYRAAQWDEAVKRLMEADRLLAEPNENRKSSPAYAWFFLAMAHHRLGHVDEAKRWLDKAVAWTDKAIREADTGKADLSWNRHLTLKLLRDEAEALLKSAPPSPSEPTPEQKEKSK